jgi:hypothetical protein
MDAGERGVMELAIDVAPNRDENFAKQIRAVIILRT